MVVKVGSAFWTLQHLQAFNAYNACAEEQPVPPGTPTGRGSEAIDGDRRSGRALPRHGAVRALVLGAQRSGAGAGAEAGLNETRECIRPFAMSAWNLGASVSSACSFRPAPAL
ncbi:unnamed protein product [Effrenium voratum]|uniref:Uncharacterized protein n=1 Tax=Effrenium voratum TaxID=2562239 RepID=A0AA36NCZ0_9DINO|nr:unnamed protein product [Effrenium voratum]